MIWSWWWKSIINRAPSKNRGFDMKMRFQRHQHDKKGKGGQISGYRIIKWILWMCLSFYFLIPYVLQFDPIIIHRIRIDPVSTRSSRALLQPLQESRTHNKGWLTKDMKVYVYDLPSKFNADWLSDDRCSRHLFASEVAVHRALLTSRVRTLDPNEADFFYVPVYVSCNFSTVNGFPAIAHARHLLSAAVQLISSDHPFWNRTGGSDHVFVASHDYGACFHAMEEKAIAEGIPEFMKNSIVLQTFGVNYKHPCQEVEKVVIPPYVSPESVWSTLERAPSDGKRDIWVFFRGKMEVHPKNISGRFYSKAVRSVIWHKFNNDRRFYLRRHRFAGYQSEIVRSIFCLCPLGWAPWSPRLVESVALGCVPVVIADKIQLPFPEVVPWPEISLRVAEADVAKLGEILGHVASTNLTAIQRKLWEPNVRRALLFNDRVQDGDATWQILRSLSQKLDHSYRRSGAI